MLQSFLSFHSRGLSSFSALGASSPFTPAGRSSSRAFSWAISVVVARDSVNILMTTRRRFCFTRAMQLLRDPVGCHCRRRDARRRVCQVWWGFFFGACASRFPIGFIRRGPSVFSPFTQALDFSREKAKGELKLLKPTVVVASVADVADGKILTLRPGNCSPSSSRVVGVEAAPLSWERGSFHGSTTWHGSWGLTLRNASGRKIRSSKAVFTGHTGRFSLVRNLVLRRTKKKAGLTQHQVPFSRCCESDLYAACSPYTGVLEVKLRAGKTPRLACGQRKPQPALPAPVCSIFRAGGLIL